MEIKELIGQITAKEADLHSIERALAESKKIAREIENNARLKAKRIIADAEAVVASRKKQLGTIEQEIATLEENLYFLNQLIYKDREIKIPPSKTGDFHIDRARELTKAAVDSIYTIKLVYFVNARHYVKFGQSIGPVHAHSWQAQIEVKVPAESTEVVAFAKIFEKIKLVFVPYENTVLNDVHPFNKVQPTTENIALYFFNQLEDALAESGLSLDKLAVWETPTKGVEVVSRYTEFDTLAENSEKVEEVSAPYKEAAATGDNNFELNEVDGELGENKRVEALAQSSPQTAKADIRRSYTFLQYVVSFAIISLVAFFAYHNILAPPLEQHYPWGSDTWGHLFKAEYLYHEILKGNYYPQFTEYWYNGSQPFRYWAPLPYYLVALLRVFTGDIFIAGNYFIFVCALFGGLSWLFFAGRIGLWPSTMAGIIWVIWLDNVRVAFSEGNLPRVLATALLPLVIVTFLQILEKRNSYFHIIATVVLIHLVVLCHAMIGAVYCLSLSLFAFFLWVFRGCQLKDCLRGVLVLAGGIATAAWWLLPSLTGSITEIDAEAIKSTIQFVSPTISMNPYHRFTNRETFYWGISLILAVGVTFLTWRSKPPWAKSLTICGILLVLITFPSMRLFYLILPLSHLLWPLRFSSFAALALLASSFTFNMPEQHQRVIKSSYVISFLFIGLFTAILIDCLFSVRLIAHTGGKSFNLMQSAELLKTTPGWRVATIDLSRLESAPSFVFSEVTGREQVFGWAWQGAVTSNNIMLLNTGLEYQYYPFLFRSCVYLGATDLIVKDDVIKDTEAFNEVARHAGYRYQATFNGISVWHSVDQPYLVEKKTKCLVVGKYAGMIALQFPEVEMGSSKYIDDYQLEYLKKYPTVIFTGAEWRSKTKAEKIVTDYTASGGRAFIELAGMPKNVLAKQPEFLGVYGEAVSLQGQLKIFGDGINISLQPFSTKIPVWTSYVPQELDEVEMKFTYYGNPAPVYGYKLLGDNKVFFLGGNIAYHAFLTGDPFALSLLRDIFGLSTGYTMGEVVPLKDYRATKRGYEMSFQAERDFEAIVPVAALDGIKVELDGDPWPAGKFENLLQLDLPAGSHEIVISLTKTPVYQWGAVLSLISLILILAGLLYIKKTGEDAR